jgi:hypothetical protein
VRPRGDAGFRLLAFAPFLAMFVDNGLLQHLIRLAGFFLAGIGLLFFHDSFSVRVNDNPLEIEATIVPR